MWDFMVSGGFRVHGSRCADGRSDLGWLTERCDDWETFGFRVMPTVVIIVMIRI